MLISEEGVSWESSDEKWRIRKEDRKTWSGRVSQENKAVH